MTSVGIVGGLGVGATVHYYEKITAACKARGVVPDLMIVHADVDYGQGLVRLGKLVELADYLASFIERLAKAGAQLAVLPAVTPHIAITQLKQRTRLPILNIVDPIEAELKARKIGRVAARQIAAKATETLCSDCPLACKHIGQLLLVEIPDGAQPRQAHPIEVLARAYGLA